MRRKLITLVLAAQLMGCSAGLRVPVRIEVEGPSSLQRPDSSWQVRTSTITRDLIPLEQEKLLVISKRGEFRVHSRLDGRKLSRTWQPTYRALRTVLLDREGNRLLVAHYGTDDVLLHDLETSRLIWEKKIPEINEAGVFDRDTLWVLQGDHTVLKIDLVSGEILKRRNTPEWIASGPVLTSAGVTVLLTDGTCLTYDRNFTEQHRQQLSVEPLAQLSSDHRHLLITDSEGRVVLLPDPVDESIWRVELGAPIFSPPLLTDDQVVIALGNGEITALDRTTGEQAWSTPTEGLINTPLQVVDGLILAAGNRGHVLALDLESGGEVWRIELNHKLYTWTAHSGGIIVAHAPRHLSGYDW